MENRLTQQASYERMFCVACITLLACAIALTGYAKTAAFVALVGVLMTFLIVKIEDEPESPTVIGYGAETPNVVQFAETPLQWPSIYEDKKIAESFAVAANRYSLENRCDTPDFIIGDYLYECFEALSRAVNRRDSWHNSASPHEVAAKQAASTAVQATEDAKAAA